MKVCAYELHFSVTEVRRETPSRGALDEVSVGVLFQLRPQRKAQWEKSMDGRQWRVSALLQGTFTGGRPDE
jgi:hypothetical protein